MFLYDCKFVALSSPIYRVFSNTSP